MEKKVKGRKFYFPLAECNEISRKSFLPHTVGSLLRPSLPTLPPIDFKFPARCYPIIWTCASILSGCGGSGEERITVHHNHITFFDLNPLIPRLKPWAIQSFLTFDSMDSDHSLESC